MRRYISILLNTALFACELLIAMPILAGGGDGTTPLRYFSVLSNLLAGAAALIYLMTLQAKLCGLIEKVPPFVTVFKYSAACAVGLTLTFSCAYILPMHGFESAFGEDNLTLHMILPIMAIADQLIFDREGTLRPGHRAAAMIPGSVYCGFYLFNLVVNGYGGAGHPNDWYRFGSESPIGVWGTLAALILVSWVLAVILRLPKAEKIVQEVQEEPAKPAKPAAEKKTKTAKKKDTAKK